MGVNFSFTDFKFFLFIRISAILLLFFFFSGTFREKQLTTGNFHQKTYFPEVTVVFFLPNDDDQIFFKSNLYIHGRFLWWNTPIFKDQASLSRRLPHPDKTSTSLMCFAKSVGYASLPSEPVETNLKFFFIIANFPTDVWRRAGLIYF